MKQKTQTHGFSLVAVLIATALLGFLAIGFSKLIINSQKGQKGVQNSVDFDSLKTSVQQVLLKPDLCSRAFRDSAGNIASFDSATGSTLLEEIRIDTGIAGSATVVKKDQLYAGGLTVKKLELRYPSGITGPIAPDEHFVELIIEAERSTGGLGGSIISNAQSSLKFVINTSAGIISGCSTSEAPSVYPPEYEDMGGFAIRKTALPGLHTMTDALDACAAEKGVICSYSQWMLACKSGKLPDFDSTSYPNAVSPTAGTSPLGMGEWIEGYVGGATKGNAMWPKNGDCNRANGARNDYGLRVRCCMAAK